MLWLGGSFNANPLKINQLSEKLAIYRTEKPLISIVIPAFNEAHNLAATLSSLADLKLAHAVSMELIVVNDGSTDGTRQLLEGLDIHAIHHPQNLGRQHARQSGLDAARGTFLFQADADTLYPPGWGKRFLELLQQPEHAIVYGSHAFLPMPGLSRTALFLHELLGDTVRLLKSSRQHVAHINVHGFNSALRTRDGRMWGSYDYPPGSSEDGHMAVLLGKHGLITSCSSTDCMAYTSSRKLAADGGLMRAIWKRVLRESQRLKRVFFKG